MAEIKLGKRIDEEYPIISGRPGLSATPNPGKITGTNAPTHSAMLIPLAPCIPTIDSRVRSLYIHLLPEKRLLHIDPTMSANWVKLGSQHSYPRLPIFPQQRASHARSATSEKCQKLIWRHYRQRSLAGNAGALAFEGSRDCGVLALKHLRCSI